MSSRAFNVMQLRTFGSATFPHNELAALQELMNKKDLVGDLFNQLRLRRQRSIARQPERFTKQDAELEDTLGQMLMVLDQLDSLIGKCCYDLFDMIPACGMAIVGVVYYSKSLCSDKPPVA